MDRPLVLAHRGARRRAPENTIEAFRVARELGADGVELDVRLSADGVLVVEHDPTLTGGLSVAHTALAALRAAAPGLATLSEALDECAGLLVNVEIKKPPRTTAFATSERVADEVVALCAAREHGDRVLISSFELRIIDRVRAHAGAPPTGYLFQLGADFDAMTEAASAHGHRAIHPDWRGLVGRRAGRVITRAHALGLDVNAWTVNRRSSIARLARLGVDGIVTDVPDVARDVL